MSDPGCASLQSNVQLPNTTGLGGGETMWRDYTFHLACITAGGVGGVGGCKMCYIYILYITLFKLCHCATNKGNILLSEVQSVRTSHRREIQHWYTVQSKQPHVGLPRGCFDMRGRRSPRTLQAWVCFVWLKNKIAFMKELLQFLSWGFVFFTYSVYWDL